jgi:hypothetical protein
MTQELKTSYWCFKHDRQLVKFAAASVPMSVIAERLGRLPK